GSIDCAGRDRAPAPLPDKGLETGTFEIEVPGEVYVAADIVDRQAAIGGPAGDLAGGENHLQLGRVKGGNEPGVGNFVAFADLHARRYDIDLARKRPEHRLGERRFRPGHGRIAGRQGVDTETELGKPAEVDRIDIKIAVEARAAARGLGDRNAASDL